MFLTVTVFTNMYNFFAFCLQVVNFWEKARLLKNIISFSDREQAQGVEDRGGSGAVGLRQEDAGDHRSRTRLGKGRSHGDLALKPTTRTTTKNRNNKFLTI